MMPMLTKDWKPNQTAMPDAISRPNMSSARWAARMARRTMKDS
jgi:hypothetical protein